MPQKMELKQILFRRRLNQECMQLDLTLTKGPADTVSKPDVFQRSPIRWVNSSDGRALKC